MIAALNLQIKDPGIPWTERERRMIEVLIMRVCAHANFRLLSKAMRIQRMSIDSIYLLVNHFLYFENPITSEEADVIINGIRKDVEQTLEMCQLEDVEVLVRAV